MGVWGVWGFFGCFCFWFVFCCFVFFVFCLLFFFCFFFVFLGNGVRTHVNSKGKMPSTGGSEKGRTCEATSRRTQKEKKKEEEEEENRFTNVQTQGIYSWDRRRRRRKKIGSQTSKRKASFLNEIASLGFSPLIIDLTTQTEYDHRTRTSQQPDNSVKIHSELCEIIGAQTFTFLHSCKFSSRPRSLRLVSKLSSSVVSIITRN